MEFVDNRPTYRLASQYDVCMYVCQEFIFTYVCMYVFVRLRMGTVGESYAIEAARRMELPAHVLLRAGIYV